MTNLLSYSLASIVAIPPYILAFLLLKREKELLNRLLEKNGLTPIGEEKREAPPAPEVPRRKISFKMPTA